jgi:signal transduction histidine kinase
MESMITIGVGAVCLALGLLLGNRIRSSRSASDPKKDPAVEQQASQQQLHKIFDLISTITSTLIYQRVLELVLDLGAQAVAASSGVPDPDLVSAVYLFSSRGKEGKPVLTLGTCRHMVAADQRVVLPASAGIVAKVVDGGEPVLTSAARTDPELNRLISLQPCNSLFCLPLRVGLDAYGVVFFAHPQAAYFDASRREVLSILTHQAVIALQNARLYSDLEEEKERMLEIQEEARKKLARDLHDGPTQSVSAIAMRINFSRRLLKKDVNATAQELEKIEDLARRATKEIRHMLFTLRPLVLESQGLVAALSAMAEKMRETYEQNVIIEVAEEILPELEIARQTVLFYLAEEGVNNARKHAQAEHIWVRLKRLSVDLALLEIKDDGVGFDPESVGQFYETRGSLGMVNLRERTDLINGLLRIESAPNQGTSIQVIVPLTEEAADRLRHRNISGF